MNSATIVSPRAGDGLSTDTAYRCQLADDYPVVSWQDITAQTNVPSAPNCYTVTAIMTDATLAAVQADNTYVVLYFEVIS